MKSRGKTNNPRQQIPVNELYFLAPTPVVDTFWVRATELSEWTRNRKRTE